jgi:phosphatidate phosphatase APP1
VPAGARFGVISDIDDTVLESNITHWQTAAQLVFLHNAQTRKPLEGVAGLYQAFHRGAAGSAGNPIFYVSASPWNLYDLLEDFLDLNGIPQGPILLRDVDANRASFRAESASLSKLEHIHRLIERYPALNWVLMGDSGQIDADLYARTIARYPGKILAIYIRDVDPAVDSSYDKFVDGHIERIAGSGVPMLRVGDSNAIAAHAHQLGLIESASLGRVAAEVVIDQALPPLKEAAASDAASALADAVLPADERPAAARPRPE